MILLIFYLKLLFILIVNNHFLHSLGSGKHTNIVNGIKTSQSKKIKERFENLVLFEISSS